MRINDHYRFIHFFLLIHYFIFLISHLSASYPLYILLLNYFVSF